MSFTRIELQAVDCLSWVQKHPPDLADVCAFDGENSAISALLLRLDGPVLTFRPLIPP